MGGEGFKYFLYLSAVSRKCSSWLLAWVSLPFRCVSLCEACPPGLGVYLNLRLCYHLQRVLGSELCVGQYPA